MGSGQQEDTAHDDVVIPTPVQPFCWRAEVGQVDVQGRGWDQVCGHGTVDLERVLDDRRYVRQALLPAEYLRAYAIGSKLRLVCMNIS